MPSTPPKPEKLTELQAAFVREYVVDFVAGRAWQRAQVACGRKASPDAAADQEGCRALRIAKVRAACDEARDSRKHNTEDMRQRLLDELVAIAYSDVRGIAKWVIESCHQCWDADPNGGAPDPSKVNPKCAYCRGRGYGRVVFTDSRELTHAESRLYDGMTQNLKTGEVKVSVRSRDNALSLLAKHFGITVDRVELSGPDGGPIEVTGARDSLVAAIARRTPR